MDEEEAAEEVARTLVARDEELASDVVTVLRYDIELSGDPMEIDPGSDTRRMLRRLNGLTDAITRLLHPPRG